MKKFIFLFFLVLIILYGNCNLALMSYDNWKDKTNNNSVDIYVGGCYQDSSSNYVPCYWKNNEKIDLPNPNPQNDSSIEVNSIFIAGRDIFFGGAYSDGVSSYLPCYWKNGALHPLPGAAGTTVASIQITNGVVYSAGYSSTNIGYYWINDKQYTLPVPTGYTGSQALSIYVESQTLDFYISGDLNPSATCFACYWKNGRDCAVLDYSLRSIAWSICSVNGKVYIAGYTYPTNNHACYWVDGNLHILPATAGDFSEGHSIFVYNGDIYIAGFDCPSGGVPFHDCYWKNDEEWLDPSISNSYFGHSVYIYNNDVYMAGSTGSNTNPFYSINGTNQISLYTGSGTAMSIAVKPRM